MKGDSNILWYLYTMKVSIIALCLACIVNPCFCQKRARDYMDSVFISLLQTDGILLSDEQRNCPDRCGLPNTWRRAREKKNRIAQDDDLKKLLLSNFFPKSIVRDQAIQDQFIFRNKSISFLGSQILPKGNVAQLQTSNLPLIPVIGSGNQLALNVLDNNASNYLLNFSTKNIFEGNVSIDAAIKNNPFVRAQAGLIASKKDDELQSISVAAGIFKNQLGDLFERMKRGDINSTDFYPLYYIWSLYKSGQISEGDSCLLSFNGMCYSTSRLSNLGSNATYNADVEAKFSIPILSLSSKAKGNWDEARNLNSKFTSYTVIMFDRPQLIEIPALDQIEAAWKSLSSGFHNIPGVKGSSTLPYNSELSIVLKFGPIPNTNILNTSLEIDKQFTFSKIGANNLIKDITLDKSESKADNGGIYAIKLDFVPNDLVINDLNKDSVLDIPIRLYYSNIVGKDTLDIKYDPLSLKSEAKPLPFYRKEFVQQKLVKKHSYEYQGDIYIDPPGNFTLVNSGSNIPQIIDIAGLNASNQSVVKTKIIHSCNTTSNSIANSFHLTFELDSTYFYNSIPDGDPLEFLVQFYDNNSKTIRPFNKKLLMNIIFPDEVISSKYVNKKNATALFSSNLSLLEAIDTSIVLKSNITLGEYIATLRKQNVTSPLAIVEAIKNNTDLTLTVDNKYLIGTRYLKKEID